MNRTCHSINQGTIKIKSTVPLKAERCNIKLGFCACLLVGFKSNNQRNFYSQALFLPGEGFKSPGGVFSGTDGF